ncbi:protein root UVB sensitive 2 chloroplastic [Phtheirospermum japonicum]|uniref:Protein root UVB sensitive 2 chloroplastic n=1 Tax=Phtheirospermum japonicum TaxID=374723 RepID=A0A830D0J2_9LAMI|nr:protein root UVB sensitive 2 chloroplastic [Phtheirospermum japonicum]
MAWILFFALLIPFQSLLFAAGFRPTPAKAMTILKDGMQYVGKLICSNLGVRMDSEPKSWRVLGVDYYLGYSDLSRNQ